MEFLSQVASDKSDIRIKFDHGTTTLGFKFKDGVIIAVDSRATAGSWIGKHVIISSNILYYSWLLYVLSVLILASFLIALAHICKLYFNF